MYALSPEKRGATSACSRAVGEGDCAASEQGIATEQGTATARRSRWSEDMQRTYAAPPPSASAHPLALEDSRQGYSTKVGLRKSLGT